MTKSELRKRGTGKPLANQIKKNSFFYLIAIPGIIAMLLFSYIPMTGIYLAFENYTYKGGIFGSEFVGLRNFKLFFGNMDMVWRAVRNTVILNFGSLLLGLVANVAVAVILNEVVNQRFRMATQAVMLFPHFLSWMVVGAILTSLFARDGGLLNRLIEFFGGEPIHWYTSPQYWWVILITVSVWKGFGYGSIIYYSTITGFDPGIYEAAIVDGASRWQRIWMITVPLLKPTIVLMFLLSAGSILSGSLDFIMGMTKLNPALLSTTDTVTTLVYRMTMLQSNFGSGAAASIMQSMAGTVFVLTANLIAKKINPEYALF